MLYLQDYEIKLCNMHDRGIWRSLGNNHFCFIFLYVAFFRHANGLYNVIMKEEKGYDQNQKGDFFIVLKMAVSLLYENL